MPRPIAGALYLLPRTSLVMHVPRGLLSGNKERDKTVVVAEKKTIETTQKLNQFWYETGQAVVQSTFEVQSRSLLYMQNTFLDGIETLKSNLEASRHWLQTANPSQNQQEAIPSLVEDAYKRNMAFMQRAFEHGVETFRGNTEVMRDLTQKLLKKAQEQQETFWS